MRALIRIGSLTLLALSLAVPASRGAGDIDRTAVDLMTPAEIKWVRNAAGTNEQAVLFGDPSKPGPHSGREALSRLSAPGAMDARRLYRTRQLLSM